MLPRNENKYKNEQINYSFIFATKGSVSVSTVSGPSIPIYKDPTVWICVGVAVALLMVQGVRVGLLKQFASRLGNGRKAGLNDDELALDSFNGTN